MRKTWSARNQKAPNKLLAFLFVTAVFLFPQHNVSAAVVYGSRGNLATGTTSLSIPYPGGIAAGDLLIVVVGNKYPTNGPTTPTNWTAVPNGQGSGGLGSAGADSGAVYATVFVKEALGTESGNLALTLTSANTSMARMFRYTKSAETTWSYAATNGTDNSAGTTWSVTGAANPGIISGDILIVGSATNGNRVTNWTESISATGTIFGPTSERHDSSSNTGDDMAFIVSEHPVTSGTASAPPVFTMTGSNGTANATSPTGASFILRIREVVPVTTTLASGTDPAATTIAPGAAATDVDLFTLQTNSGTETITSVTVNLSTNSGVGRLAITNNAGTELGFTTSPVTGSNTITVAGMSATTTLTTFKIRVTPLSHAAMPVPNGGAYVITAPVTAWVGPNVHTGSDTNPNALTIDNLSPTGATSISGIEGNANVTLNWMTSASADFSTNNGSVVYRWAASSAGTEVPTEGSTPTLGSINGTATLACRVSSAAATPLTRIDGTGGSSDCTTIPLTVGQSYTYKIFQKDSNGNYDTGVVMGTFTPNNLTCFTDNFERADVTSTGYWVVANEGGTFGNPTIVNGRLRLTDNTGGASTMAALRQLFPAAGNKIVVELDHYAYYGTGADGMCVVLSDASIAPVPGAFGGSLGYAPKQASAGGDTTHAGFAGGWLGVALDEWGNFSNPTEGRTGGPGSYPDSVALRGSGSLYTGYAYLAGTTTLTPGIDNPGSDTPAPGYRYRITIDHLDGIHAYTSVERNTGTGYTSLIAPFDAKAAAGQAAVPTNWYLSFTGSTGAAYNIHDFDNLQVCSTQPQPLPTLDHVRILHDGQGNTCAPETIILQACADATCSTLYLGTVKINLNNIGTWTPTSPVFFSGGQTTVTLSASGSVTLGGAAETPIATHATTCYNTTTGINNCTLNFAATSLSFDVPDHTSATRQLVTITDCTAQLADKTRNVKFWSTYLNPSSGTKQGSVVTGTGNADCATEYSTLGTTYTGATTLSLTFSSAPSPKATFSLCYPDAGKVQLNALYEGSVTNIPPDTGVLLLGNDTFVAKPALFALSNIKQTAAPQLANPAATDASGNKFVMTGEAFTATVTAQNAKFQTTPNFSKETNPEGVRLTSALFAPAGGANSALTCKGSTTECVVPGGSSNFTNGATTITDLTWNEVGIITITPIIGDRDYLGAGDITGTASDKVGRFIPDHFAITPESVTEGCDAGNFTYFGQDGFSTAFTLTAQNKSNTTTKNYTGGFAKLVLSVWDNYAFTAEGLPAVPGPTSTLSGSSTAPTGSWSNGVASVTARHRASRPSAPVAPADITISAKPTDTDGATAVAAVAVHAVATPLRFGRLVLQNAFGPETEDHKLPFQTQYFDNAAQWVTNTEDSCTTLTAANFSFGNYLQQLTSDEMNSSHINVDLSTLTTSSGIGSLYLTKPSGWDYKYLGSVDVTALIDTALPWLQYEWDGADNDYNENPTGRINFGIYRGNDRIINWREIIR